MLILTQHDHAFRVDFIKKVQKPASKIIFVLSRFGLILELK